MVLLDRNWRCEAGEIDLVLRDGPVLVICEVKTRTSTDYGTPLEAVTPAKVERLRRLASRWLRVHDCHPDDIRLDMVGVLAPPGGPVEVEHVEGIG
jgi:putative endonuclease